MAAGISQRSVVGGYPQDASAQSRSLPSSPKSLARSSHGASSGQADADFSIPAWHSWKEGDLRSLHNQSKFAGKLADQVLDKAGYRRFGHDGIKHKSVGFAAEQFSSGGRSDGEHRKALIQGKALVTARLLKLHSRTSSSDGKKSWGGVVAAFKRFDYLFDHSVQEHLVPVHLRGAAPDKINRLGKMKRWSETLVNAGCWTKRLLRLAHIFTGLCEMNSAPHGFYFRCIMNIVSRNIAITSPAYKLSVFTVTGALGILVASLYHVCTTTFVVAAAVSGYLAYGASFAALSGTFGGMAFITGCVALCLSRKVKLNIAANTELQATMMREADVQLYQIDALIKTVLHNLQQSNFNEKFSAENLLQQQGNRQGNAYGLLCKAMQRETHGYQASRVGRSTLVGNSEIVELLCNAYYTDCNLRLDQKDATVRITALRKLIGDFLNGASATPDPANQRLGKIPAWCHQKAAKHDSLQRELNFVFLRELAAIDDAFLEPENMAETPQNYVNRVAESKQERKDSRIRFEDWCKTLNKKGLTGFQRLFNKMGLVSFSRHFKAAASDNRYAADVSYKDEFLSSYKHHPEVIARNLHCYTLPIRVLMTIPKILQSFCFNWVLAVNAQNSRLDSSLIRFAYTKATGRLPSRILCTNLGRFFGGFQVVLFTLGLGALANVASAVTQYGLNGGSWVFSTIITGTLMAILGLVALPFVLAASALVYLDGDKYFKGQVVKPEPRASRIKNFTFAALPANLIAR